jgi:hypothetical protein
MEQQTFFPLLPKLKQVADKQVGNFPIAGVWDCRGAIELDNLSESLDIEKIDPKYFDIDCIPDMWARPLLFEMALYDANHLLHERILGEWRGLLTMLALKEWRNLTQLRVMPVQIPKPAVSSDAGAAAFQASPEFLKALGKLAPSKTLSDDTPWHNLYVILFGDKPIGITSPTTLVCTAADYYNCIRHVTWFDGRFLSDPTPCLGSQERKVLASWLEHLKENLTRHEGINQQMWNTLLGLLSQFQVDLGGAPEVPAVLSSSDLGMRVGIFRYFDTPIRGEIPTPEKSHVLLKPRAGADSPSLLVVDRKIPEQWNMPDYEVFVWGTTTIASFPFAGLGSNRSQFGSTQLPPNVQLRLPEDFFTEKLFVIDQLDAFPGAMRPYGANLQHQGRPVTPIIPIKDELLNYLTTNDLRNRIRFEPSNEGIVVKLRLPLSGPDGKGRDFEMKREFRLQANEVISIPSAPVLEVWPNFKASNWKAYYTYFSTTGEDTFYAEPYALSDMSVVQTFENNRGATERQITRTSLFPEAMKCKAQVTDIQTNVIRSEEAGVLLITQPQQLPQPTRTWAVGVDFGTTGTNVYANDYNREPFLIQFEKRFLQVTAASEARRSCLYDDFLPGNPEDTPFLSFFHDFQKANNPPLRPLLDGHIYFLLDYEKFNATAQGMATDLKWSSDPTVRIRTQAFLEQLCLQCAAEAVANGSKEISWRFSFPTAFSAKDQDEFRQIWKQITETCASVTGLAQSDSTPKDEPESIVSARFFAEHPRVKAPFAIGTVCIDIGGGTSDISIWQDNELRWQTSLRFAGRDIFLNLLYENPDFLKIFQVDDVSLGKLNNTKGNRAAFYAQADALISHQGQEWLKNLQVYAGIKRVEGFVQLIAVGLSGLYYYVGTLLQYLHKSSRYNAQMPNVYVAGNGARIFHWVATGNYNSRSPINTLFKNVLLKASGFQVDPRMFEVKVSPQPKAEAAFGLVCGGATLKYDENVKTDEVVAGELFIENGKPCDWSETLTAERLKKGLEAQRKLERFEDFVQTFDTYAKSPNTVVSPIAPDAILMNKIYQRLSQTLADFRASDENSIHVEPLFIIALKTLLEVKTNEWASKNL